MQQWSVTIYNFKNASFKKLSYMSLRLVCRGRGAYGIQGAIKELLRPNSIWGFEFIVSIVLFYSYGKNYEVHTVVINFLGTD